MGEKNSKYPYDMISYVRKKTFSIEPRFSRETEDNFMQIFDKFSRFVFTVIANGKATTCNVHIDDIPEVDANTEFAHRKHLERKYESKKFSGNTSPAFTVRFFSGNLKGKTPVQVLLENGESGRELLKKQYDWLNENISKYPDNKKLMNAIEEALNLDTSQFANADCQESGPIELLKIDCRPLTRKQREDGKCFCYEMLAEWDSSKNYPVSVRISNYYAPFNKKEDGTLNVILSQKDTNSEIRNEFNMTAREWLNAVHKMTAMIDGYIYANITNAFKIADRAVMNNKKAATSCSTDDKKNEPAESTLGVQQSSGNPQMNITLRTCGNMSQIKEMMVVPILFNVGDITQNGKLYFNTAGVEYLENTNNWKCLVENAHKGVEMSILVEKKGDALLFIGPQK